MNDIYICFDCNKKIDIVNESYSIINGKIIWCSKCREKNYDDNTIIELLKKSVIKIGG